MTRMISSSPDWMAVRRLNRRLLVTLDSCCAVASPSVTISRTCAHAGMQHVRPNTRVQGGHSCATYAAPKAANHASAPVEPPHIAERDALAGLRNHAAKYLERA